MCFPGCLMYTLVYVVYTRAYISEVALVVNFGKAALIFLKADGISIRFS